MMQPFAADIVPSRYGTAVVVLLHAAALAAGVFYFYGLLRWGLTAALAASMMHAWRRQRLVSSRAVRRLQIDTGGRAFLTLYGQTQALEAVLLPQSLANRVFCLLVWQTEQGLVRQHLLPDMVPSAAYRRILVWAYYGRADADGLQ